MNKETVRDKKSSNRRRRFDGHGQPDLSVKLGSLELRNPVMIASGLAGYGDDLEHIIDLRKVGAVVTKTLTLNVREGNSPPRLVETASGLINSIGLANIGVAAFISQRLGRLKTLGTKIVVSVGGFSVREYGEVVVRLEEAGGFDGFEVNVSCPNVRETGMSFGTSPARVARVVRAARSRTSRPLIVKLTPNVTNIAAISKACVSEGADALTVGNTFKALAVDTKTRRPLLGSGMGGLSGPAIRALCLAKVLEVVSAVNVPVVACGGICTADDALQCIIVGASAFQVGSACLRNFRVPELVLSGVKEYLRRNGISSVSELRGTLESTGI